jgi:hypothetical protein
MNWNALKSMACPQSGHALEEARYGYRCSSERCTYFITKEKFDGLVQSLYTRPPARYEHH